MKTDNTLEQMISAIGIIIPVAWDENGNPQSYAISTYDETEYLIDGRNQAGRELMRMNQQKIHVTGTLGAMVDNRRILTVSTYNRQ